MKNKPLPSQQRLRELISYDSETGIAIWLPRPNATRWNPTHAGNEAGGVVGQYRWISIDDTNYLFHRIVFKYMTGLEPIAVDHKNTNKLDNRWENLRAADMSQNRFNTSVTNRSLSGVKGVRQGKNGKWQGIVTVSRKAHRTLQFDTLDEAREATDILRASLHGSFARN